MQQSLDARLTRLETLQPATAGPSYRAFATVEDFEACTDDLRGVKVYLVVSPDDWHDEAVQHDD